MEVSPLEILNKLPINLSKESPKHLFKNVDTITHISKFNIYGKSERL